MISRFYLVLYNVSQLLGWSYLFALSVPHWSAWANGQGRNDASKLYADTFKVLQIFQTLAVLEIIHAAIGLVKSNPVLTGFQVFSRVFVTLAVVSSVPEAQSSPGYALLLLAWTVTEIIRYSFYAFNLLNVHVPLVTWLRYTLFIFLYPLGVTGELWCAFSSLDPIKRHKLYTLEMPNKWNFAFNFHVVMILIMLSYFPIFPQLYFHMFRQRRKIIGGEDKKQK